MVCSRRAVSRRTGAAALVLACCAVGLTSCEREPTGIDVEQELQVHGMLAAGSPFTLLMVGRTGLASATLDPVTDATVRLIRGGDTFPLAPVSNPGFHCLQPDSTWTAEGCYYTSLTIGTDETFLLDLLTLGEERVTGRVSVPRSPEILAPAAGSTIGLDCADDIVCEPVGDADAVGVLRVRWRSEPSVGRIELDIKIHAAFDDGGAVDGAECRVYPGTEKDSVAGDDSVEAEFAGAFCSIGGEAVAWDSLTGYVHVTGYDTAYARYVRVTEQSHARREELSAGLDGALGFFAASSSDSVEISFTR